MRKIVVLLVMLLLVNVVWANSGWVDILTLIDVERDALGGQWTFQDGVLIGFAQSTLETIYELPLEYDILWEFESNSTAINLLLASPVNKRFEWMLKGWSHQLIGIREIDCLDANNNESTVVYPLQSGIIYECVIKVRDNNFIAIIDGNEVLNYATDWSNIEVCTAWNPFTLKQRNLGLWLNKHWTKTYQLKVKPYYDPNEISIPVADADGPYTIYVNDTLILDASASTDDSNDIVSYMWDIDDNGTFETDSSDQPILSIDYSYLESLGLHQNNTYNIILKVTDSQDQSDTSDTSLTILSMSALEIAVDIKPGSCPNPFNVKSRGVLPIAILGSDIFDANTIVPTSVRLAGVEPIRDSLEDVATPLTDPNECECTINGPDGFNDLTLKFSTQQVVEALGEVNGGDLLTLPLTGVLNDGTPIEGEDCVVIVGRHKPINKADFNTDKIVDFTDFLIFCENWLKSSL